MCCVGLYTCIVEQNTLFLWAELFSGFALSGKHFIEILLILRKSPRMTAHFDLEMLKNQLDYFLLLHYFIPTCTYEMSGILNAQPSHTHSEQ